MATVVFFFSLENIIAEYETPHRECIREMLSSIVSHRRSQTLRFDPHRRNERPVQLCNLSSIVGFRYFPGPSFFVNLRRISKLRSRCFSAVTPPRSPILVVIYQFISAEIPHLSPIARIASAPSYASKKCNVQFQQYLCIYAGRYRM